MRQIFAALLSLCALASASWANPYAEMAEFRLLKGWTKADGTRVSALEITLADGWKTYWRAPGASGVPLQVDWANSRNLGAAELHWPRPVIFDQGGMRTIGYKHRLVLPILVTPKRAGKPVKLKGAFDLGVCSEICVPVHIRLEEVLERTGVYNQAKISAALEAVPQSAAAAGGTKVQCTMQPSSEGVMLEMSLDLASLGGREDAIVETTDPLVWATEPQVSRKGGKLTLRTTLVHALGQTSFAVARGGLRFTLIGSQRAVDLQGCG